MSARPINLTVVHDDFLLRVGLTTAFDRCDDMSVRTATLNDPLVASCDIVVTDFEGGMHLLAALRRHPENSRRPRIAIVAGPDREWQIRDALKRGAAAYLVPGVTGEELVEAMRTVHRGGCHLSNSIATKLAESLAAEPLTEREIQVLSLVGDGLCNKRIAAGLQISLGTVKAHLRSAFEKLQVRSRTEAIATAERRGLFRQRPSRGARSKVDSVSAYSHQPETRITKGEAIAPAGWSTAKNTAQLTSASLSAIG